MSDVYFTPQLILEIHASLVTEKLLSYKVEDLLPDGRVYLNPELIEGSDSQVCQIRNGQYQIISYLKNLFNGRKHLPGYVYLSNGSEGLIKIHEEPVPDADPKNLTGVKMSRFLTSQT